MFKFEGFDFNKVYESRLNTFSLSLDDWDDDNDIPIALDITKVKTHLNFDIFLQTYVFNPLGINPDINSENDKTSNECYAWKKVQYDGEEHYIAYIYVSQEGYAKHFYVILNNNTHALHIGMCSQYSNGKYFTVNYPLIKICETYADGPVYIGQAVVDIAYGYRETPLETLNKINLPLKFPNTSGDLSLYYGYWNKKPYFYPKTGLNKDKLTDVDKNVHIPHEFIQHLKGFSNNFKLSHIKLFYKAFESFEDFAKFVTILCKNDAIVETDLGFRFDNDKYNYEIELKHFHSKINEVLGIEEEIKNQMASENKIAREKLENILPATALQHFDSINDKSPNLLSVYTLFKERTSKDPYRKFDLPVIELILKDNGIDIEKIAIDAEKEWLDKFYEFANMFIDHCRRLKLYERMKLVELNIFENGRLNFLLYCDGEEDHYVPTSNYYDKDYSNPYADKLVQFDGLTDKELELIQYLFTHLRHTEDEQGNTVLDKSRVNIDPNDKNAEDAIHALLYHLSYYKDGLVGIWIH